LTELLLDIVPGMWDAISRAPLAELTRALMQSLAARDMMLVSESVPSEATLDAAHDEAASRDLETWLQCACTVSEIQMAAEKLLPDLRYLLQLRVQGLASRFEALIQVGAERQLTFVEVVSDEAGDENLIHLLLDLSRPHGPTFLANFCGSLHGAIR
jgi:hypothetical protein